VLDLQRLPAERRQPLVRQQIRLAGNRLLRVSC
jgi:hypothetical protein